MPDFLKLICIVYPCFALSILFSNEGSKWISEDFKSLELSAQEGDPYAQAYLALSYIHGDKGLNISFDKASYWANQSAESNHWLGDFVLGYLHRFAPLGPNTKKVGSHYLRVYKDPDAKLIKNVISGDPIASYALAEIFSAEEVEGEINPDLSFAVKHYAVSSMAGFGPASVQHAFFKVHADSIGVQDNEIGKDVAGGISILKELASNDLPAGHHYLGRCYFKGIGLDQDYKMALVHFQAAADRGYTTSQLIVAHFYAYGLTGPAKIDIALRYANLALVQEREKASEKIAEYEELLNKQSTGKAPVSMQSQTQYIPSPVEPNFNEPPPLPPSPSDFSPSSSEFKPTANRLPSVYERNDFEQDVLPSASTPAASNNLTTIQTNSISKVPQAVQSSAFSTVDPLSQAKMHYFGRGADLDLNVAFTLFSQSAESGNPEAARYLGIMYLRGKGVSKDSKKALDWFTIAADGGDELAKKNMKTLQILNSQN